MRSSAKKGSQRRTITNITELYKNDQINLNVLTLTLVSRPPARQTHKRRKCREAVPYLFWQALTSYGEAGPQFCWEGNLKANYNVDCPGGNSEASGRCLFFLDQVRWKFFYSSNSCRKIWPWLGSRQVSMDCIYQMWDWNVTSYILHLVFGQVQINWISSMFEVFVSTLAWNTDIICRVQSFFTPEEGKVKEEISEKSTGKTSSHTQCRLKQS